MKLTTPDKIFYASGAVLMVTLLAIMCVLVLGSLWSDRPIYPPHWMAVPIPVALAGMFVGVFWTIAKDI